MKRSFTYLKGLLTFALAAFTGWMWAAELVIPYTFDGKTGNTEYAYEYQVKMPSEALTSFTTTIRYAGGDHRVEILGVKLIDGETEYTAVATGTDGTEIADEGSYSGGNNYHNIFTFTNGDGFTANKVYTLQAMLKVTNNPPSHRGNIKVSGGITLYVPPYSFGVNFTTESDQNISTTEGAGFSKGSYAKPINWGNFTGSASGNGTITVDGNTLKVYWTSRGTWNSSADKSTDDGKLLYGYLDDTINNGRTKATVTITGLPSDKQYAVALILSGDGADNTDANGKYSPALINGQTYSYVDGALVSGDAAKADNAKKWGDRRKSDGTTGGPTTPTEGQNVMFVEGLSGSILTITSAMDAQSTSRLTIAGVQVWTTEDTPVAPAAPTDKEVVSLNFYSSQGSVSGAAGLVAAQGWNNLAAGGTETTLAVWNGEEVVNYPISLTYSANNGYQYTGGVTDNYIKGYLDDGGSQAQVTVENIPFEEYSVIVYAATDTADLKFKPVLINGSYYAGVATPTAYGYADLVLEGEKNLRSWGASRNAVAAYGKNALRVDGLSGDLTIKGGSNGDGARGGIAAIQIVNTGAEMSDEQIIDWTAVANPKTSELPELTNLFVQLKLAEGVTLEVDAAVSGHFISILGDNVTVHITNIEIGMTEVEDVVTGAASITTSYTETLGYTKDGVTYPLVYRGGTDGWSTFANWATGTRTNGTDTYWIPYTGSTIPGVPGTDANPQSTWDLGLIDGNLIGDAITADEDGYKVVNTPTLEGWAFKIAVANGVHVKVSTLNKLQGECIVRVDDSSKITVTNKGNGNNAANNTYYIDAENGLVFENMPMPGGTAYLGAAGSITTGSFAGNQTIAGVKLDLGDNTLTGRKVVTRTLYTYTSALEFTVADGAVTTDVEDVEATEAVVLQNVGDYKFVKTDTAYQVQYVAYAETDELDQANVWNGAVDSAWETEGNWTVGVPEAGDDVTITVAEDTTLTIPEEGVTVGILIVNGAGTLTIAGGKITAAQVIADGNIIADSATLALAPTKIAAGVTVAYTANGNGDSEAILPALTGEGTFSKFGPERFTLESANACEPQVIVNAGTLRFKDQTYAAAYDLVAKDGATIQVGTWAGSLTSLDNVLTLEDGAKLWLYNGNSATGAIIKGTILIDSTAEKPAVIQGNSFGNNGNIAAAIKGNGVLEIQDADDNFFTISGVIADGDAEGDVLAVKVSTDRGVTFTGANTYTGGTEVAVGANLTLNGSVAGAVNVAGTLSGTGTMASLTLADGATLAGAVTVTGNVTLEGAVNITHATAVDAVVITCANAAELDLTKLSAASEGLKYIAEGGVVKLAEDAGSEEPDPEQPDPEEPPTADYVAQIGETGYTTLADAIAAVQSGATITLLKDATIEADTEIIADVTLTVTEGKTLTIAADATVEGVLAGAGALVVESGTLTLRGANTYTGGTTVNGGTLVINGTTTDTVVLPEGKTVTVNADATIELVQGLSYVKVEGEGTTEVTGTYTFGISSTLDTALATKTVTVAESGILQFRAWKAYAFSVASLTVNGTIKNDGYDGATVATMTVAENQTLSGSGTIELAVTLADGATLAGAVTVNGDVIIGGTISITHAVNAGDVVLNCANAEVVVTALGESYEADGTAVKVKATDPGPGGGEEPPTADYVAQIGETGYTTLADAIAAVQSGDTITLLKDATLEADTEIVADVTLTVTEGKTLTIAATKILTVNGTLTGAVAGAGTLVCNGAQAGVTGLTAETWTGTVKLDGITTLADFTFATYGNANSTIEFLSTASGYLAQAGSMAANLVVTGSITFNNGWSSNGGYTFNGALTGTGTLATANDQTDVLKFLGETKDYAGTITVNGRHCIAFGEQADTGSAHEGKLIVAAGKTANIAAGKTWTAVNGIEVAGTIGGEGTMGSPLILRNGATLANAMTLAEGVTVTVVEGTAINHAYATQIGDTVLTCANAADVVAKLTCTLSGLAYMADGNAIKLTNGPERITLPTLENAKWYYNGTEVAGSIEANDSQRVTLQLKTDAGYLFADGTTSKEVTVDAGETTVTLPADATVVAAVAQIGETLYLTLEAALTAVQSGATITLLQDVTIEANTEIATGVTLAIAGKTLTIPAGKTLTVTGAATGAVAGAGTIVYNGALQTGVTGLTAATWTGTVKLDNIATATNLNLSLYGNADSTIELGNLGSATTNQVYFPESTVEIPADVVISGTTHIRNGSSRGVCNFKGAIRGEGTLAFSDSSKSFGTLKFYGDVSGFTGTIMCEPGSATRKFVFLTETSTTTSFANGITVADGYTLTVNATYPQTMKVLGTIKQGTGSLAAVTFANGATIDASEAALVVTGDVTLPTDGTITVTLPADATIGTEVLTCANAEAIDTTKFSEAPEGRRYAADGTTIKLVEALPGYVYTAVAGETNAWTDDKWTLDGLPITAPTAIDEGVKIVLTGATTLTVDADVTLPVLTITGGDLTLDGSETLTTASLDTTNKVIVDGQLVLAGGTADAPIAVANVIEVNNGTLTTDGYVNLSNENNKIGASGTLVVANGVTSLNAAEQGIKGTTTIQAGATLKNARSGDALAYNTSGVVVNVYGTLDMGETRWTIFANNNTINAYAGATITGAGQGANGALDVLEKTTGAAAINVLKNGDNTAVTISAKIRFREGTTNVNIAEGVTATLSAGTNGLDTNNGALRVAGAGTLKIADSAVYNIPVTVADATTTLVSANGKIKSLTLYGKLDSSKATLTTDTLTIYNGATLLNKPTVTGTVVIPNRGTLVKYGAYATNVGDVVMTCSSNANAKIVAALMKVTNEFYYVVDGNDVKLADRADAAVQLGGTYGYYTTFEEAYGTLCETLTTPTGTALDRERTISLLKDLTMEKERSYDFTELTLNLNGCNLMPQQCIFVGDNFTITNTETTGKIDGEGALYALWIGDIEDANTPDVEAATNVTIENLTIDGGLTLCNAKNVTLRNLKVLNANYEAVYVDAESEAITIDGGAYEGHKDWGAIGFNTNEYTTTIPVEVTGTNLEMSPAPLKVPTGLSADLIAWLKDVMADGDMMVGSSTLDVTDADLEQAYLLGIVPAVTDQNDVNVKSTFGVSDVVVDSKTVTLTVAIAVQAGALPDTFALGGTVKLMAWETLDDMDAPVEVDPANYTVTVTRVSDTEATISVTPLVDTYKFFKIVVE